MGATCPACTAQAPPKEAVDETEYWQCLGDGCAGTEHPAPITVNLLSPAVKVDGPLDDRDIDLVQQTFARVAMLGVANVGLVVFSNIFEIAPGALELFPFAKGGSAKDMLNNGTLRAHSSQVVETIATAVSLLRDLPKLVPVLEDLGKTHGTYGVIADHYDVVGQALVKSLGTALGPDKFTEPVKNAYLKVYTIVKTTMLSKVPAPDPDDEYFASLGDGGDHPAPITVDLHSPPVKVNAPLDERDIQLVQQTFKRVAMLGVANVGLVVFSNIFEMAPAAKELFSFAKGGKAKDMHNNGTLRAHASIVVETLATAVGLLRDLPTLVPVLQDLGKKHVKYGVVPEHYDVVGKAIIKSLATALGDKFTDPVKNAYLKVYTIVKNTMVGNLYK